MGIKITLTKEVKKATLIIGFKKHLKQNFKVKRFATENNIPIYSINRRSVFKLIKLLSYFFNN